MRISQIKETGRLKIDDFMEPERIKEDSSTHVYSAQRKLNLSY